MAAKLKMNPFTNTTDGQAPNMASQMSANEMGRTDFVDPRDTLVDPSFDNYVDPNHLFPSTPERIMPASDYAAGLPVDMDVDGPASSGEGMAGHEPSSTTGSVEVEMTMSSDGSTDDDRSEASGSAMRPDATQLVHDQPGQSQSNTTQAVSPIDFDFGSSTARGDATAPAIMIWPPSATTSDFDSSTGTGNPLVLDLTENQPAGALPLSADTDSLLPPNQDAHPYFVLCGPSPALLPNQQLLLGFAISPQQFPFHLTPQDIRQLIQLRPIDVSDSTAAQLLQSRPGDVSVDTALHGYEGEAVPVAGAQPPANTQVAVAPSLHNQAGAEKVSLDPTDLRERSDNTDPRKFYREFPAPASFGRLNFQGRPLFEYGTNGLWAGANKVYAADELRDYVDTCPRDYKLWIQHTPAKVGDRNRAGQKCRYKNCPVETRTIDKGWLRVAFDEEPVSTTDGSKDPFMVAGCVHLWCFEQVFDVVEFYERGTLVADARELPLEQKNPMALTRDTDWNIIDATLNPWMMDHMPRSGISPRKHSDTLSFALNKHHLGSQNRCRQKTRNERNENRALQNSQDVHMGDLSYFVLIDKIRRGLDPPVPHSDTPAGLWTRAH